MYNRWMAPSDDFSFLYLALGVLTLLAVEAVAWLLVVFVMAVL